MSSSPSSTDALLGKQEGTLKRWVPSAHRGALAGSSLSPGCCGYLGRKAAHERPLSLCLSDKMKVNKVNKVKMNQGVADPTPGSGRSSHMGSPVQSLNGQPPTHRQHPPAPQDREPPLEQPLRPPHSPSAGGHTYPCFANKNTWAQRGWVTSQVQLM